MKTCNEMTKGARAVRRAVLGAVFAVLLAMGSSTLSAQEAAAGAAPPEDKTAWKRSAALGLSISKGNSDTILFTASVDAIKKWQQNEVMLGALATYGEDDGEKNNELVRGIGQYNRLFTDRFFGYARLDALHDAVADVEYRIAFSPGVGYYFIKNDKFTLSGEIGPGYIQEKVGRETDGYFTIRFAERFEYKITERSRLWQSIEFLPEVTDFENYIMNAEVGLETALSKVLDLRVLFQDTYDNVPAPGRKENDMKLITALAVKF